MLRIASLSDSCLWLKISTCTRRLFWGTHTIQKHTTILKLFSNILLVVPFSKKKNINTNKYPYQLYAAKSDILHRCSPLTKERQKRLTYYAYAVARYFFLL